VRSLDPEEAELWARVTATIRPLSRKLQRDTPPAEPVSGEPQPKRSPKRPTPKAVAPPPVPHAAKTLDGSWDKRLRGGSARPDRTVDLHGHSLDSAWWRIDDQLEQAIASGDRLVLLITGHERRGEPPIERGRIRAAVHDWLAASRHASSIAAVRAAHPRHGGGGSLYIVLRRT
jgi:DNA-nicking Smr family endonuclease